ncbi:MAG: hypothetical protein AAFR01_05625, partial [Pseudomonadota bacterium]
MDDARVNLSRGVCRSNIERLSNYMLREFGDSGSGLDNLSNTALLRDTSYNSNHEMNKYSTFLTDDINSPSTPSELRNRLEDINADVVRLQRELTMLNMSSRAPGSDQASELHYRYRELANKVQSLRDLLPKDIQDGQQKTLELYKDSNPDARGLKSFDELPGDVQSNAMRHIHASLRTAANLEGLANESYNRALSLLTPEARVPGGHGSFFEDKIVQRPTNLRDAKPGDIGNQVKIPKEIYKKVTDIEHETHIDRKTGREYEGIKKRSRMQRFFDRRTTQDPRDMLNKSAIIERNLSNATKLYNGMVERTQKSLLEYQSDPKSLSKLEALIEDAEYTSVLGNRLMSETKNLASKGKRVRAGFLKKLHAVFRPSKHLENG